MSEVMEGGFTLLEMDTEVCTNPWCGMDLRVASPEDALARARVDQVFFWHYFLLRCPHPGQRKFILGANATINALACSNRYGKTTIIAGRHFHKNIFKVGAEHLYLDPTDDLANPYEFNVRNFMRTRYRTVHTAGEWDQAAEVWEDANKLRAESPRLEMLVTGDKKSMPPHINFLGGARWLFRTLGVKGSGIDGKNFYLLSIDEGGWIADLEEMMRNVLQIRIADVRGQIDVVGTFKPGMSKDFFKICVRASAATGVGISFDHRSQSEGEEMDEDAAASLDEAIFKYAKDVGFDLTGEILRAKALGVID